MTATEWKFLKDRILCSRPFLALYVLMGRPVMYRMTVAVMLSIDGKDGRVPRVVDCTFLNGVPEDTEASVG